MNIEAKHISVIELRINDEISSLLDKYQINTYEDLINYIHNNTEISNNYYLNKAYFDFKAKIMTGQLSSENVYQEYLNMVSQKKLLNIKTSEIDKMVKVVDLPLFVSQPKLIYAAIHGGFPKRYNEQNSFNLQGYNIENLKKQINNFIVKDGEIKTNLIYYRTGKGEIKHSQLIATLKFYEKYIDLLLKKYFNKENPFYYMYDGKLVIAKEKREQIFNYLYSEGYELIFCNIDNVMKIVNKEVSLLALSKKLNLIENVVANYVTYNEALDIISPKVLNKFIISYGKK